MMTRRAKKNKGWALLKLFFFAHIVICAFAIIWLRTEVIKVEYEINQLEGQKIKLARQKRLLLAERANLYSAGKVEEVAMKQLGMSLPKREMYFLVEKAQDAAPYKASAKQSINRREVSANR